MNSREQFEGWVVTHHRGASLEGDIWDDFEYPELVGQFIYDEYDVQNSWASWQASRQALEIKLPQEEPAYMYYAPDVVGAIEATGVRVKE